MTGRRIVARIVSGDATFAIRFYRAADQAAVRAIYGSDEFARPHLQHTYPRMSDYLADSLAHYTMCEPESTLVATVSGRVVGALLGATDTGRCEQVYEPQTRRRLIRRCLSGAYGWPVWLVPILRTEWASRHTVRPQVDLGRYPAHLHIGILPEWRRKGLGSALMAGYVDYLSRQDIAGFHLYAASFHPLGVAFYRKLGLDVLGRFEWRFHDGQTWVTVTEYIFGQALR